MSVTLIVHDIGCASDPAATVHTEYSDAGTAYVALTDQYGAKYIRGTDLSGTIGSFNGAVFQASKTWRIA